MSQQYLLFAFLVTKCSICSDLLLTSFAVADPGDGHMLFGARTNLSALQNMLCKMSADNQH